MPWNHFFPLTGIRSVFARSARQRLRDIPLQQNLAVSDNGAECYVKGDSEDIISGVVIHHAIDGARERRKWNAWER